MIKELESKRTKRRVWFEYKEKLVDRIALSVSGNKEVMVLK
jgi:hypothetical protein